MGLTSTVAYNADDRIRASRSRDVCARLLVAEFRVPEARDLT